MMKTAKAALAVCLLIFAPTLAYGISIDMVTVGNPGNLADMRYNLDLRPQGSGGVDYVYQIAKNEVTAAQYAAFLNAVARTDTYGLYHPAMDASVDPMACNIKRTGESGAYTYSVAADWANRPVHGISWLDAARFANWLSNGQPVGPQGLATTEDGSYFVNGATTATEIRNVTRKPGADFVLPNLDEWHKAAYYDPNKPGGAGYWDYPTGSDAVPSNSLEPWGTNNANYRPSSQGYTIGSPYFRTEVGTFANSPSPYGTFDQAGNAGEWVETGDESDGQYRKLRGGSSGSPESWLHASGGISILATLEFSGQGFRVALVPEPGALILLVSGGLALLL